MRLHKVISLNIENMMEKTNILAELKDNYSPNRDLSWLLRTVCEETSKALGFPAVGIMLYEKSENILRFVEGIGLPAEFRLKHKPIPGVDYQGLIKQVSPAAIILNGKDDPYLTNAQLYRTLGIKTVIFAELRVEDALVGSLNVFIFDKDQYFAYDDLCRLQDYADLVAQTIAQARTADDHQKLLDNLELACDAGIALNSLQNPDVQLESLLQIVMATVEADKLAFYRYQSPDDTSHLNLNGSEHRFQHGILIYENGLGHSPEEHAVLKTNRIEVGDESEIAGWVATNLIPLYIPDLRSDSRFNSGDSQVSSVFGVPVAHNKILVGVLVAMMYHEYAFDKQRQIFLRRMSTITAVAMKNAKTLEKSRNTLSRQAVQNRILKTLLETNDINQMVSVFLDQLLKGLEAAVGGVWVYNCNEEEFILLAQRGLQDSWIRFHKEENLLWHVHKYREVYHSNEFWKDPKSGAKLRELFPRWVGGVMVPIMVDKEFVGVYMVGVKQPNEIKKDDVNFLVEVAPLVGNAIQRITKFEKSKRDLVQSRGLQAIDQAISASMDLRFILKVILDKTIELLNIDAADVLLLNIHTQTLEFAAGVGFETAALQHTHLKIGEGRAGKAASERRIIHIPNLPEDLTSFLQAPLLSNEKFLAYYAIPLISKGQVTGVLELFHRDLHESSLEWRKFLEAIASRAAIAIDNVRMFENLQRSNAELMLAYDTTLEGWSRALELHDRTAPEHTNRVANMATQLARELGVSDYDEVHIRRGAILHDIGNVGIPAEILNKRGPLSEEEWEIMRCHPNYAYDLLAPIPYLRPALDIPYCHHERWDGQGYPVGLKGEQIPLAARIFSIVDVWDSMLSHRPYREALSEAEALEYIKNNAGTQFDPAAVDAFMNLVD